MKQIKRLRLVLNQPWLTTNHHLRHRSQAFSLLELLAVVTIIGIIAVVAVPRLGSSTFSAKVKMCDQYKSEINAAAERYRFNEGSEPTKISDLESNPEYYFDKTPDCPVTQKPYTLDAGTGRVSGHNH